MRDLLKAIRPYGNPMEQDMIDMAETLMEGQTPMDQMRRFLTPEQQSRFETMEMMMTANLPVRARLRRLLWALISMPLGVVLI